MNRVVDEYNSIGRVSDCGFEGYGFKSHYSSNIYLYGEKVDAVNSKFIF